MVGNSTPPTGSIVNPGVLMTLGMQYAYPLLPLKQGVSIAKAARPGGRSFAAHGLTCCSWPLVGPRIWPADPMVDHVLYAEAVDVSPLPLLRRCAPVPGSLRHCLRAASRRRDGCLPGARTRTDRTGDLCVETFSSLTASPRVEN